VIDRVAAGGGATPKGAAPPPAYAVAVSRDGTRLQRFSLADLRSLPVVHLTIDGKEQDGPALTTVLEAAGVNSYQGLTVVGYGLRDRGRLTLSAAVARGSLLDFSNRGTVKFCSPTIAWDDWVRDVTELRVR
jgi:hypothetical protein